MRGAEQYMNERKRINRSGDICIQMGQKGSFLEIAAREKRSEHERCV